CRNRLQRVPSASNIRVHLMELPPHQIRLRQPQEPLRPPQPPFWKKMLAPIGVALLFIVKLGAKLKFIIFPLIKFLPVILKTGGSMVLTMWLYAQMWGWKYAVGFVLLIFIHESGHLVAAR